MFTVLTGDWFSLSIVCLVLFLLNKTFWNEIIWQIQVSRFHYLNGLNAPTSVWPLKIKINKKKTRKQKNKPCDDEIGDDAEDDAEDADEESCLDWLILFESFFSAMSARDQIPVDFFLCCWFSFSSDFRFRLNCSAWICWCWRIESEGEK